MSKQSSIKMFYKVKTNSPLNVSKNTCENIDSKQRKKRNLSLVKSPAPSKSPKVKTEERSVQGVISLSSDEEDFCTPTLNIKNLSQKSDTSDSSSKTIIYSMNSSTPLKTPITPRTPTSSSSNEFHSTGSKRKFFSPSKNRSIVKRSPAKRNLNSQFSNCDAEDKDEMFEGACSGMDDKTIFLLTIINECIKNESLFNLLNEESQVVLSSCLHVVKPGMRLICRLYWRQDGWYKVESLTKILTEDNKSVEKIEFDAVINSLLENKLIEATSLEGANQMTFDTYTKILKSDELKQICKFLKLKMNSKQDAIEALRSFSKSTSISNYFTGSRGDNSRLVLEKMSAMAGPCYKLTELARFTLYKLYLLMYVGINYNIIRDKKLELMLIYDKIQREVYPIDKEMPIDDASVIFKTNDEFERYVTAHCIYEEFLSRTDVNEKCAIVNAAFTQYNQIDDEEMLRYKALPIWLRRYTPAYILIKILDSGIQELKKDKSGKHDLLALQIVSMLISQIAFRQHKKADWYAEKALIFHRHFGQHDEAAAVLLEGFKSDMSEEAKDSMRPRALKLAKQKNITISDELRSQLLEYATKENILEKNLSGKHISKLPMERGPKGNKVKFETRTSHGRTIQDAEEYCITEYIMSGEFTHGQHWEGRIVTTIFFLLFWDIIYTRPRGVKGVFLSRFQQYPLDLFSECFYINRKTLVDEKLKMIEQCDDDVLLAIMEDVWQSRPECELSGIVRSIEWHNVREVSLCLHGRGLAAICRRLALNYSYTHSGFPDLTLWNIHNKKIKFVEVKTDSDKPSMKQIQWMHYLREHGIDTEFCYVGVNTTRAKSRPSNV